MRIRHFSVTLLLSLLISPYGGPPGTLQHVLASTLQPSGPKLKLGWDALNYNPLVVQDGVIAVRTPRAVEVIDAASLRVVASYPFRRGGLCGVGLDGTSPVALVGCGTRTSHSYAVVRFDGHAWLPLQPRIPVLQYPVSFAFGDGKLFIARARGSGIDVVDLHSGAVTSHRPRRSLTKGGDYVQARWLGAHLLGLNGTVVDTRTWRERTLSAHARETIAGGDKVATYGSNGVAVFTRADLRLYRRVLRGQVVDQARIVGDVLYAKVALLWHVVDLRTGRTVAQLLPDDSWSLWLL